MSQEPPNKKRNTAVFAPSAAVAAPFASAAVAAPFASAIDEIDVAGILADFDQTLARIVAPPMNMSIVPEALAHDQHEQMATLMEEVTSIITLQEEHFRGIQQFRESGELMEMGEQEKAVVFNEAKDMVKSINDKLQSAQFGTLTRQQKQELTDQIIVHINYAITIAQTNEELTNDEKTRISAKELSDALFEYFTIMAAHSYDNAPNNLTKIGLYIAGLTLLGSSLLVAPSLLATPVTSSASVLLRLSNLAGPVALSATAASGIGCLQAAGVNVEDVARKTLTCIGSVGGGIASEVCNIAVSAWRSVVHNFSERLGDILTKPYNDFELDDSSIGSVATAVTVATAATVARNMLLDTMTKIDDAISIPEAMENPIQFILDNPAAPPSSPVSDDPDSQLTEEGFPSPGGASTEMPPGLGGRRKTKRNKKSKKSKKCKKGGKRNKTKKHKKHHKTLKH